MQRVWITLWLSWMLAGVAMASAPPWELSIPGELEDEWLLGLDDLTDARRCAALGEHARKVGSPGEEVAQALAECPPEPVGEAALQQAHP